MLGHASSVFRSATGSLLWAIASSFNARTAAEVSGLARFALIYRRFIRELCRRNVRHRRCLGAARSFRPCVRYRADLRPGQIPLIKNALHLCFAALSSR
jgi:hypothetical protein